MHFNFLTKENNYNTLDYYVKWFVVTILVVILIGSASALFLYLLERTTETRTSYPYLLYGLPIGGGIIGLLYHYYGKEANQGNNLIITEYHSPSKTIPFKMFPFVLIGTLISHLFGASVGREGTAVQMGGTIADQFTKYLSPSPITKKTLLLMGVTAGFSSVFGTPLAGIFFAFELMLWKNFRFYSLLPIVLVAFLSHYTCLFWGIEHTSYTVTEIPALTLLSISKISLAGILFGLTAYVFIFCLEQWGKYFKTYIKYPPLRPFIGAILFLILILLIGNESYLGLGIPVIQKSFTHTMTGEVFILKILFTTLVIGTGFKGGEVTPLFFIGATLGSFLSIYTNLPISFMAAIGFVAVFSGATKTPLACTFMGIELFGIECAIFLAVACFIAYFLSGKKSIYSEQLKNKAKTTDIKLN